MKIMIDGIEFTVEDSKKTIVEIAKDNGIFISAPCYYQKSTNGCCNGCIILVNGKESLACETIPEDGMSIIYDRDDLVEKRARNLTKYAAQKEIQQKLHEDNCSTHSHKSGGCCGSGSCGDACSCTSH